MQLNGKLLLRGEPEVEEKSFVLTALGTIENVVATC